MEEEVAFLPITEWWMLPFSLARSLGPRRSIVFWLVKAIGTHTLLVIEVALHAYIYEYAAQITRTLSLSFFPSFFFLLFSS